MNEQARQEHWIVVDLLDDDLSCFYLVASCRGGLGLEPSVWSHVKILLETDSLNKRSFIVNQIIDCHL